MCQPCSPGAIEANMRLAMSQAEYRDARPSPDHFWDPRVKKWIGPEGYTPLPRAKKVTRRHPATATGRVTCEGCGAPLQHHLGACSYCLRPHS